MYNINYKNIKKGRNFGLIFLIIGLVIFGIMAALLISNISKRNSLDASVQAYRIDDNCRTNSDGDYMCSPIYYYTISGNNFVCRSSSSSSVTTSSSKDLVYYNSSNPSECMTEYESGTSIFLYLFIILPIIFIAVGVKQVMNVQKRIKKIKYLEEHGTLIKGLIYVMEPTNMTVNGRTVMRPAVDYQLPSGSIIHLQGDPRHDGVSNDADGLVDLLIDLNDPSNYYIDFEINRKM